MGEDIRFGWPHIRRIVRLREQRGWTQSDLALEAQVSTATIRRIEDRERLEKRQRRVFRALGKVFGVDPKGSISKVSKKQRRL